MNQLVPTDLFADFSNRAVKPFMRTAAVVLIFTSAFILLYWPTLKYPFAFDDGHNIVNNPHIRMEEITLKNLKKAGFESPNHNRPLANISFAFNYYFQGYSPAGYRLVNFMLHILGAIFIYFLVRLTLNISSPDSGGFTWRGTPFFSAFIWLVHPLQTQSVTYVVQRMNILAAMFCILCLLLYAGARLTTHHGKKWGLYTGCIIAGVLALGSKENAAMLPAFIFLYEWFFFQDISRAWLKKHLYLFAVLFVFIALILFIFLGNHPIAKIFSGYDVRDFTLTQRVLTEFRVVVFYGSLVFLPHPSRLNLDHDFPLSFSLISPFTTLFSILAIVALAALAWYLAPKERFLSFGMIWFLGNLAIESSFIPLEIIFEHRTYLPLMFGIPTIVFLAARILKPEWLKIPAMIMAVAVCAVWSYDRNTIWQDEITLWSDCRQKSPGKARPHYNLGLALEASGRTEEAIQSYRQAVRIDPNHTEAYNNLGVAHAEKGMLPEAVRYYSISLRINPDSDRAHHNLGLVLARQGKMNEAVRHFSEALRINPNYANAHHNLGIALASRGRLNKAVNHLTRAVNIRPDFAEAFNNLGLAQVRQGNLKQAVESFSEALRINPDYRQAQRNLRLALRQSKKSSPLK